MRQIFLDTETTGLSPESGDRVIELGCIEMDGRRLTGRHLHFYFNPERRNSEDAVKIHGLTDEFLADKPLFASVVDEFVEFVRDAEIIIHNAGFDVGFLNEELRRCGRPPFSAHVGGITDSLQLARDQFPGKANSLDALCKRLEVDNTNRTLHGALRFAAEYFREPDDFLGLLSLGLSMGQWLCVPMVVAGAILFAWGARQPHPAASAA